MFLHNAVNVSGNVSGYVSWDCLRYYGCTSNITYCDFSLPYVDSRVERVKKYYSKIREGLPFIQFLHHLCQSELDMFQ